jgi:thiamine pyrophosphokinase
VNYCVENGYATVSILGATGLREDHTLGNISLLLEYHPKIDARIITDHGEFSVLKSGETGEIHFRARESPFLRSTTGYWSHLRDLKYPLDQLQLHNWWRASLNEATGKVSRSISTPPGH